MKNRVAIVAAAWLACAGGATLAGCDNGSSNVLGGVPSIAYLSQDAVEPGNVFDYTNGGGHGNIFTLTPPTASGKKVNLTNWSNGSINSMDVSFDAREIVFSGKADGEDRYHVFRINVDGSNPCDAAAGKATMGACQITDGPNDEVYPIYIPGGRVYYQTNKNVEGPEVPQFRDEYERATTAQAASMDLDGSNQILGPRNVSHRVSPTLMPDGRILLTEWRHLGDTNEGDLISMNQDLSGVREAFGREGKAITNSHLRGTDAGLDSNNHARVAAIGTSRDRTFQAGKLILIDLGGPDITSQSEALSSVQDLTPDVPGDRSPSFQGVGRYYDVRTVDLDKQTFLTSWSDGFVETSTLAAAKASPDFGIYLYDAIAKTRSPIVNEIGTWEYSPIPIVVRAEPPELKNVFVAAGTQSTLFSAINVNDSTMFNLTQGQAVKVRLSEGFSAEEGAPNMFGLTDFDGMSLLGEADVQPDGSYKALVPANVPVRQQLIDRYGMAVTTTGQGGDTASEPLWMQGRPGEARVCGGCHENRTESIQLAPGSSALQALGASAFDYVGLTRQQRQSEDFTPAMVKGVPWDKALQPIFDAKCVSCHDGTAGPANPSYSITFGDMSKFSWTFDLSGRPVPVQIEMSTYTFSASHISLLGPDKMLAEKVILASTGTLKGYVSPGAAHLSEVIQKLNPPARYPAVDLNDRARAGMPIHPADVGGEPLTPDEYYLMILMADNGGQFYSRENIKGY